MTEHVHEWEIDGRDIFIDRWYENGLETMTVEEATRRLNEYETLKAATERLSAGVAETIKIFMQINSIEDYGYSYRCLCAYANILEGKDA